MLTMCKAQLLESIETGYAGFQELLAGIEPDQMIRPGAVGKWSVKDTVAHIVIHEQRMLRWMQVRLSGKQPEGPQPYNMPDDELEALNESIYQENLDRSLQDVLHDLEETHRASRALVQESREEDLVDPACLQLLAGEPLWEAIAANTFWHYAEHGEDIRKRLKAEG